MTPYGDMSELARGSEEWLTGFAHGMAKVRNTEALRRDISQHDRTVQFRASDAIELRFNIVERDAYEDRQ